MMLDWYKKAHEYKERAEIAEEQVRQLRDILRPNVKFPAEWKLSPAQSRMLALLALRGQASTASLSESSKQDPGSETDPTVARTQICCMRPKLAPFGVKIGTQWQVGYYLTDKSREIVNAALRVVGDDEKKEIHRGDDLSTEGTTA